MTTEHPTSEALAAWLSRRIASDAERDSIEAHLAICPPCREEVVRAERLLARRARTRRVGGVLGIAAIAAALLLIVRVPFGDRRVAVPTVDEFRGDAGATSLVARSPAEGATVPDSTLVFRWSRRAAGDVYRVSLLAESGERLWAGETVDTELALPADQRPAGGRQYVWYVDAVGVTGDSSTSGPVSFRVR